MTGTPINVGAVPAGTGIVVVAGARLGAALQPRVLSGLGLVALVLAPLFAGVGHLLS